MSDSTATASRSDRSRGASAFWTAFSILIVLLLISFTLLSIRLYDYVTVDDRELSVKTNLEAEIDIFSVTFFDASGEVTVQSMDGDKVVAPGTDTEYTIRLRNTDSVALDYDMIPRVTFSHADMLPIQVRMLDPEDNYIVGDAKTWVALDALNGLSAQGTLAKHEAAEYTFQWRWPFEWGDDEYDTMLGDAAHGEQVSVEVSFSVLSEANTTLEDNGGFVDSGLHWDLGLLMLAILLLIAVILLIVYRVSRRRAEREEDGEDAPRATDATAPDHAQNA